MKLREVIAIIAWTAATSWGWGQTSETPSQVNWALPLLQSGVTSYQFSVEIPAPRSLEIPEGRIYSVPGQVASPPGGYPDVPLLARTIPGMAAYTPVVAEATSVYIDIRDVEMAEAMGPAPFDASLDGINDAGDGNAYGEDVHALRGREGDGRFVVAKQRVGEVFGVPFGADGPALAHRADDIGDDDPAFADADIHAEDVPEILVQLEGNGFPPLRLGFRIAGPLLDDPARDQPIHDVGDGRLAQTYRLG